MSTNRAEPDLIVKKVSGTVEDKYRRYSVEDFTQDDKFIQWVRNGANQKEWESLLRENPHLSANVRTARGIIESFRQKEKRREEEDIYETWKKIELFHSSNARQQTGERRSKQFFRYAAVFILALSLGAIVPVIYIINKDKPFAAVNLSPLDINETKLILSGGEEVLLKEKQTELQFNASGDQIKVNQDSVIHYTGDETVRKALTQVVVPFGKISNIQLSDGTRIWLNAGSQLLFPQTFEGKERKVYLTGEAYFDVARNKNKPFIVSTNSMNVTVTGTEFNLRDHASDNEVEVVLVEGEVSLKENSRLDLFAKETKLKPDQRAVFNKSDSKVMVESDIDSRYYTSWRKGLLEFRRESILRVFEQLARYYHVRFVTEESVELNKRISGKLDLKESLEEVMKVVSDAAPITYRIEGEKVYVNSKIPYLPMQ
ncbi:MAG: FecR family protein [Mangrovibacterium sp.]